MLVDRGFLGRARAKDILESIEEAMVTASRATTFTSKGEFTIFPEIPKIYREKCDLCGKCISLCPANALKLKNLKC